MLKVAHPRNPTTPGKPGQLATLLLTGRGLRECARGPIVSGTFASFAELGGPVGRGVAKTGSVAALVLARPPGTQSMAHQHPDGSHKATLSLEVNLCLAFNSIYLAIKEKKSGILVPGEPVTRMQMLDSTHF